MKKLFKFFITFCISLSFCGVLTNNTYAADATGYKIVYLKNGNDNYVSGTNIETGNTNAYFSASYGGDAAYIQDNGNGTIRIKIAGGTFDIASSYVNEIKDYSYTNQYSYYYVQGNYLYHRICVKTSNGYNDSSNTTIVGYKSDVPYLEDFVQVPGATSNVEHIYYSYDGHYFYSSYTSMIDDYRNGNRTNAVNSSAPYYNYYQFLSHRSTSDITSDTYNAYVANNYSDSKMTGLGQTFIDNQNTYGVNALLMYGTAGNESGYGTSTIAKNKNNLFGHHATDTYTYDNATGYANVQTSVQYHANKFLSQGYLNYTDWRYNGSCLGDKATGINVRYASDPYQGEKNAQAYYKLNATSTSEYRKYTTGYITNSISSLTVYTNLQTLNAITVSLTYSANNKQRIYQMPVLITGESGDYYQIQLDTPLTDSLDGFDYTKTYSFSRDKAYIPKSSVTVTNTANGHIHSFTSTTVAATCNATGYTKYTCSCGEYYTVTIPKTSSHSYNSSVVGATCTSGGYTTHTCSICGASYTDSYTAALGHSYTTVTSAKITRNKVTQCTRCGATSTGSTVTSKTIYKGKTYNEGVKGTWKSSNKKVATVTSKGKITAKKAGTCTITAKVNGTTYKCKITVKNKTLTVSKSSVTLKKGKSTTVTAKASPSATIKWSSSNKKVATVSNGRIKAKKKGSCTISVKANGITKKIKVKVK